MIVKDFNNPDIEGDDFEGIDASIDEVNQGFLFDLVSNQMYRRPIPSVVRELTTNCFDSHIEAGIDDPVVIKISMDEAGYFISFTDVGVGISPDRMKKVYSKWFSSTKRLTNKQHGKFGLGSKVGLAYSDSFFLTTVYNSIKYEYTVHKGQKKPRIDLLIEDETQERNGTEVKLYIKNSSDASLFKEACESQLCYFDSVYIESDIFTFNNEYTVLDYKTFKYRKDFQFSKELHLIVGKVPYPINWEELNINRIELPLGIKFEIGDLEVTPERESIRYAEIVNEDGSTTQTKDIIKAKIDLFLTEIKSLYEESVDPLFDNYKQYRNYVDDVNAYLVLDGNMLNVTKLVTKNPAVFTPLKDFHGKLPKNLFFEYQTTFQFNKNKKSREYYYQLEQSKLEDSLCVIKPIGGKYNIKKTAYLFDQAKSLTNSSIFYIIDKSKDKGVREVIRVLGIKIKSKFYNYSQTNALKQLKLYRNYIKSEINRLTLSYDLLDIPTDWLIQYNLEHKRNNNKGEDEILVYNYGKETISDSKEYINPSLLEDFTGFIIYGFDSHEELLKNYRNLFCYSKYGTQQGEIHSKKCRLYRIAKRNEKYFVNLKNAVFIEEFMGNNKIFKKFAAAAMIEEESKAIRITGYTNINTRVEEVLTFQAAMDQIFPPVAETLRELTQACDDFGKLAIQGDNTTKEFIQDMINTAREHNLFDREMYQAHLKLERYVSGLDLINYIVIKEEVIPLLVDFLTLKGKRVSEVWLTPLDYEQQLINDAITKLEYRLSIYESGKYVTQGKRPKDNNGYDLSNTKNRTLGLSLSQVESETFKCKNTLTTYKSLIKYYEQQATAKAN